MVHWWEEYLLESAPYLRALYYPTRLRMGGIEAHQLAGLIDDAIDLAAAGFSIPAPPLANLSPEGRVLVLACAQEPTACSTLMDGLNALRTPAGEVTSH